MSPFPFLFVLERFPLTSRFIALCFTWDWSAIVSCHNSFLHFATHCCSSYMLNFTVLVWTSFSLASSFVAPCCNIVTCTLLRCTFLSLVTKAHFHGLHVHLVSLPHLCLATCDFHLHLFVAFFIHKIMNTWCIHYILQNSKINYVILFKHWIEIKIKICKNRL